MTWSGHEVRCSSGAMHLPSGQRDFCGYPSQALMIHDVHCTFFKGRIAAGRPPVDSTPTPSFSASSQVFKVLCAFIYGVASSLSQKFPGQLIGRHTMNPTPVTAVWPAYSPRYVPALMPFFPVAAHFKLFNIVGQSDKALSAREALAAYNSKGAIAVTATGPGLPLFQDTLLAMGSLGLMDVPKDDHYTANDLTRYLAATEISLAGSFFLRKLKDENFAYPFRDGETPMQFAYKVMRNEKYAKEHTYAIMAAEGRMDSFNTLMVGKFGGIPPVTERLKSIKYDLEPVLAGSRPSTSTKIVDIGGGRGELLLQLKEAYPQLRNEDLIIEEFNDDLGDVSGGALIYNLSHVLHNLPDLDAIRVLQRIAEAMAPHSRILVHEDVRRTEMAPVHAAMILLFGGRERTEPEWRLMEKLAGLEVTFIGFPGFAPGLIEFRKP
ncbi:S-adenosyl-L-methionine-dependent methyltransferase [Aspergillus pseudodeflectus]|uniref:S-adenosyl-L-methionine-dependent methyltransferase n=1 Tax=Aspergillus pseudodeflectus TaxID=176178 RepID=A0ABR4K505_9EURO